MRSLTDIDEDIATFEAARRAIGKSGQSFSIGARSWSRSSLPELEDTLRRLYRERARTVAAADGYSGDGIMTATFE